MGIFLGNGNWTCSDQKKRLRESNFTNKTVDKCIFRQRDLKMRTAPSRPYVRDLKNIQKHAYWGLGVFRKAKSNNQLVSSSKRSKNWYLSNKWLKNKSSKNINDYHEHHLNYFGIRWLVRDLSGSSQRLPPQLILRMHYGSIAVHSQWRLRLQCRQDLFVLWFMLVEGPILQGGGAVSLSQIAEHMIVFASKKNLVFRKEFSWRWVSNGD